MDKKLKSPRCSPQKTKSAVENNGTNGIVKDRAHEQRVIADLNARVLSLEKAVKSMLDIRMKK